MEEFFQTRSQPSCNGETLRQPTGLLLDQLKMATYEVHRSENGRFFTNALTPETIIAENIPACYMNDLNEACSGKVHTFVYEPEPRLHQRSYAIVTILAMELGLSLSTRVCLRF